MGRGGEWGMGTTGGVLFAKVVSIGHSPKRRSGGYNAEGVDLGLRHVDLLMDR